MGGVVCPHLQWEWLSLSATGQDFSYCNLQLLVVRELSFALFISEGIHPFPDTNRGFTNECWLAWGHWPNKTIA